MGRVFIISTYLHENLQKPPPSHGSANIPCPRPMGRHPMGMGAEPSWSFLFPVGFYREGVGAKLAKKERNIPHLSIGNTSSYIFISWHSCFILPASYARFTRVYKLLHSPQMWWAVSLLSPWSENAQAPTVRLHRPISCVPASRFGVPLTTRFGWTHTPLVN